MTAPRRRPVRAAMALALLVLTGLFVALGLWQIQRRAWKQGLIAAVDARAHRPPSPAPGPAEWAALSRERDAYRRVTATGRFLTGRETLVRGVSDRGSGYWVLAPLDTGPFRLLVNRGFILPEEKGLTRELSGPVRITGLLRPSEPEGGLLRTNDPAGGRWYSRDVAAIARAHGLGGVAPYFIDADATLNAPGQPVGGLTVIRFSDNHLAYALTWFGMALLCLWALWRLRSTA